MCAKYHLCNFDTCIYGEMLEILVLVNISFTSHNCHFVVGGEVTTVKLSHSNFQEYVALLLVIITICILDPWNLFILYLNIYILWPISSHFLHSWPSENYLLFLWVWCFYILYFNWDWANLGFPGSSAGEESACNAGHPGSGRGLGRPLGAEHGNPLQYSCLENSAGTEEPGGLQSMGSQSRIWLSD